MSNCATEEFRDLLPDLAAERLSGAERARVAAHVATCAACAAEVDLLRIARQAMSRGVPAVDIGRIVAALPKPPVAGEAKPALVASSMQRGAREVRGHARASQAGSAAVAPRRRNQWMGWRIAAAATIAVGGLSVAVVRHVAEQGNLPTATARVSDVPAVSTPTPTLVPSKPSVVTQTPSAPTPNAPTPSAPTPSAPTPNAPTPSVSTPTHSTPAAADTTGLTVTGDISELSDGDVETLLHDMDSLDAQPESEPDAPIAPVSGLVAP